MSKELLMKKVILLITILFVSAISTACINNLAVQDLNAKAMEYMKAGDTEKAVCRLRSSIDLDNSIYETHYNLGVALVELKEYDEAQKSLENAINLKPDFADTYYSLAVALQEQVNELENPKKAESDELTSEQPAGITPAKTELSADTKKEITQKLGMAIDNYNKYLARKPDAKDKEKVVEQIGVLSNEMKKYNTALE